MVHDSGATAEWKLAEKKRDCQRQASSRDMHHETETQSVWNEQEVQRKEANKNRLSSSTVQTEKSVGLQTLKWRHIQSSRS
jgi:hypothetical protein